METQTPKSLISSTGLSMSSTDKWGGMIEQSFIKKMRLAIYNLTSYIYIVAPHAFIMHSVITVIRIFQHFGPCLFAAYFNFWDKNSLVTPILSILSIFFHLVPAAYRLEATIPFLVCYCLYILFFFAMVFISALVYKKNATLPGFVPIIIYILIHTAGLIIHPLAAETVGEIFSYYIDGKIPISEIKLLILCIVSFCFFGLYAYYMGSVMSTSILFRPNSLNTLLSISQRILFFMSNFGTFIIALGSHCTKTVSMICLGFGAVFYFGCISSIFLDGGFMNDNHAKLIMATSITGGIMCIANIVMQFLGILGNEIFLFSSFAIVVIMYFIATVIYNKLRTDALITLDLFEDDKTTISNIKSESKLARIALFGYQFVHPACINFSLFKEATQIFPKSAKVWVMFTKFVCIYPEENQTLGFILRQMQTEHVKGGMAKQAMSEIITILRMREPNISPELKNKISKVTKGVDQAKQKIRHIWDLVIQGNAYEIGNFIGKAYEAVDQTKAAFYNLLRQYPNSRFVVRSYSRFLLEVVGDRKLFSEWSEKYKMMQRGITVNPDMAHQLGLSYFPSLPNVIMTGKTDNQYSTANLESESQLYELDPIEENAALNYEHNLAIKHQIEELRIPGISLTLGCRLASLILIFIAPFCILAVGIFMVSEKYSAPLDVLKNLATLRSFILMIPNFGLKYALLKLGKTQLLDYTGRDPPSSLGDSFDFDTQFSYLLTKTAESVENLNQLHSIDSDSKSLKLAEEYIYGTGLTYVFYSEGELKNQSSNVQQASLDITLQLSNLMKGTVTEDSFDDSVLINPLVNLNSVAESISVALYQITLYVTDNNEILYLTMNILRVAVLIFYPCFLVGALILQIVILNDNKMTIFKCMTALPKNVVSNVADGLRQMKNGTSEGTLESSRSELHDAELNKQEENMLKVFATASDNSNSKISDDILAIITTLILIAITVLFVLHIYDAFVAIGESLDRAAPHINYLMGCYSYSSLLLCYINEVGSDSIGLPITGVNKDEIMELMDSVMDASLDYFHRARFGLSDQSIDPFLEFAEGIQKQNQLVDCDAMTVDVPKEFRDTYKCLSLEMLFFLVEDLFMSVVEPYRQGKTNVIDPNDDTIKNLWEIMYTYLYDMFFYPIFDGIVPSVRSSIDSTSTFSVYIGVVFVVAGLILEITNITHNHKKSVHLKFALSLLLHCPPSAVSSTPLISNVLSGNFKSQKGDTSSRDKTFFDQLLVRLPDALIVTDENRNITHVNVAAERLFQSNTLVGMSWFQFINNAAFSDHIKDTVKKPAPPVIEITFKDNQDTVFNLSVKALQFNQTVSYIFKDITRTVRYNTLIAEERLKSDRLLESILPAKLVKRVQEGENNISFSVQSASVCFMDIVSFTPWCGSLPAQKVMTILNMLFREFDALVQRFPTLTKIKCIGDCYMAASGIFSEINQPAVHAKEMVEFGIDCIGAVKKVNEETDQSLQIRVGINTGGPLVAGVLGTTGKPTFEILGPTINMAQQMEHHGVPMQVHISRAVYELIYGGNFKVKERGQIEIKNGQVVTYLVSP